MCEQRDGCADFSCFLFEFGFLGCPNGSGSDLDGLGTRSGSTTDEKLDALLSELGHFEAQLAQIPAVTNWMSRMDSHITTTLGDFATRLAEMEQNFSTLTARLCKVEIYAASASNVSGSARSWPSLEQDDGSTAAGPHGPGSSNDNRSTRRRLDTSTSPADEQARSAVLLRFPSAQYLTGGTEWLETALENSGIAPHNRPTRIHCKAVSVSARLVFETRAKCQEFVARFKDDGILYEIDTFLCTSRITILVRHSRSVEDRETGKQFMPLWRAFADELRILFQEGDDKGPFVVPALDARSQILSVKDRRTGIGKPVFKLASLRSRQSFALVSPDVCIPLVTSETLQRILCQASTHRV